MNRIFLEILNHAMISSLLIIAVLIVRICIKKAPKWMTCALWAMVAVKLVLPFPIESVFSLAPSAKPIPVEQEYLPAPQTEPEVTVADKAVKPAPESEFTAGGTASANPMKTVVSSAAIVWIAGMAVLCFYSLGSYWLLKRRVAVSRKLYDNVYLCDLIDSPFILGILRPGIYLPSGMEQETIECVLEHEKAHLKRYDHLWKPLGFFLLILYWFHPLCWLSYHLFCRDIEFACDEKVTKDKDKEWTANYCQALLDCNIRRRSIAACPVAFGEVGVKDRIKSVLNYRKPAFWIVAAAVILSVVVAVCFMTSPKTDEEIAEPETGAASDGLLESGNDPKEPEEAVALTAEKWAQAFCSGDGETILSMAGQEVIEQFEAMEVLERHGDEVYFSFGSSPMLEWPDGIVPYTIVAQDDTNHTADIIYYAWTSDPHVVVWREQITLTPDDGQYVVSKETLTYCDQIATAEDFLFAYPSGIRDALINYVEVNSLGEDLNNNALLSGGNQYQDLFDPATAVYDLLNIGNKGNMRTEVETSGDVDARSVKIHFPDGIIEIDVCRPYGADGIWLPYDCRLLDASANPLTIQKLVRLVTSHSWIQSQKESGITFWDEYTNLREDEEFNKESLTNLRRTQLQYDETPFDFQVYYEPDDPQGEGEALTGEIDSIVLRNMETEDSILLFSRNERYIVDTDIEGFLYKKQELPKALLEGNECETLEGEIACSDYRTDLFLNFDGCLFENSNYHEPAHGEGAARSWYSLGGAGVCDFPDYERFAVFENGALIQYEYSANHMSCERITDFTVGEYSGCLYQYEMDLFTAAEAELLKEENPEKSQYWVAFFTKGHGKPIYMKFFNCNYYSKEAALESVSKGYEVSFQEKKTSYFPSVSFSQIMPSMSDREHCSYPA